MQLLHMAPSPDGLISARYAVITKTPGWEVLSTTSNTNVTQGHGCSSPSRWCVAVISSALCAICGERVEEISCPEYLHSVHGGVSSLLAVVSNPAHQHAPLGCTAVPGPSLGTTPDTTGPCSTVHCKQPWQCSATKLWLALTLYQAYLGAMPVVRDCLLCPAPFVASTVCLALIAPSILRCHSCTRAHSPSKGYNFEGWRKMSRGPPCPVTRAQCTLGKMSRSQLPSQRHMHSALNRHRTTASALLQASTSLRAAAAWV